MNKIIVALIALCLSTATLCLADQSEQVITLKDGSQIKGQLSGIQDGVYTVKTPIIGDVHVAASDVANIANAGTAAASTGQPSTVTSNGSMDEQVTNQQQKIMGNPQAMADLQQLAQDPEIMQALSDPALVQAITTKNYQAIQNNPKMLELMNNPKMQALMQKIASQQQQQNNPS